MKALGWLLVVVVVGAFIRNATHKDFSKPWWTGSGEIKLCKVPYYSDSGCASASAVSNGDYITDIAVNGTTVPITTASECYEAVDSSNYEQFCRVYDNGQRYDVLPSWATY